MVYIYHHYKLIRHYVVPKRSYTYTREDFPEIFREMMEGGYPKYLLQGARALGENA